MDIVAIIVVALVTMSAVFAGLYAYGMSNIHEIQENWVKYRCNPIYMPIAGMVGSDILTNFTHCTMQSVQSYAGFVMDPLYQNFQLVQNVIQTILSSLNFIRQKIAGTVDAFLGIINSVFGKIQNTLTISAQLVGRIQTIIQRMISVFVVMTNVVTTGMDTGQSVLDGPIGQAANFLCFDPFVPIRLNNGAIVPMRDVRVGNILEGGIRVRSVMIFDGHETRMVSINGIRVSANHKILYYNEWIRAGQHPEANVCESLPRLNCLNTDTHTIPIRDFIFKDYEETDNTAQFNLRVADYYSSPPPLRALYPTTGVEQHTEVVMDNQTVKPIRDIRIGEYLHGGGRVLGIIIHEFNEPFVRYNGVQMTPGTLVLTHELKMAKDLGVPSLKGAICIQLLTQNAKYFVNGGHWMCILDDQEVPSEEIHSERDTQVISEKVVGL